MGFLMRIHIASQSFDHLASDQLPDKCNIKQFMDVKRTNKQYRKI